MSDDIYINIDDEQPKPVDVVQVEFDKQDVYIDVQQDYAPVLAVNGKVGYVTITAEDIGFSGNANLTNIVYTTGDQTISGDKNFVGSIFNNGIGLATLYDVTNQINQEINFTKYTYDRTVIQLSYANYIMGWNPLWDGQIPTGKNIQINLNNLNLTTYGNDGGSANINLPVTAPIDAKLRIFSNGDSGKSWSLNIYATTGIFETVTSTSPQNKRFIELIYNNGWILNPIPWHLQTKAEITDIGEIPNIESGYYYRSVDAIDRGGYLGQAPYQVVLSSDTRLRDSRSVRYRYTQNQIPPTPYATGSYTGLLGDLAYDGTHLYMLLPMPGGQEIRWGRVPVSTNWIQ